MLAPVAQPAVCGTATKARGSITTVAMRLRLRLQHSRTVTRLAPGAKGLRLHQSWYKGRAVILPLARTPGAAPRIRKAPVKKTRAQSLPFIDAAFRLPVYQHTLVRGPSSRASHSGVLTSPCPCQTDGLRMQS